MTELRYNSMEFRLPVEYFPIFYRNHKPSPWTVLKCFSREEILNLVLVLGNEYVNKPAMNILYLMADNNWWKRYTYFRLGDYLERHQFDDKKYIVCFPQTLLEILRYTFAMSPSSGSMYEHNQNRLEFNLVKTIALINEQTMAFKVENPTSIEQLMMASIGFNKEIQQCDFEEQFRNQYNLAIKFFKFLTKDERYQKLYKEFLNYYSISDWREYVFTVLSMAIQGKSHSGLLELSDKIDPDHLISKNVLDKISLNLESNVLPFKSKDEYDLTGNSDYRYFRDKPIIKIAENKYAIFHVGFVLDRLYGSLYFDFKKIADSSKITDVNVNGLFTSEFIEKTIFDGLMDESSLCSYYLKYSEETCNSQFKANKGLGAPDYLLQNKNENSVILFECKDIKVNAWIKEQRDYSLLEAELKNKVQLTTWELDYNNKTHKPKRPKLKGIGQLAGHCANIKRGQFKWGDEVKRDSKVYSVLVIADNRLILGGFPQKANEWYVESLSHEQVGMDSNIRPLIVMSPLCLLKYSSLFAKNGFEKYFEEYFEQINKRTGTPIDLINSCITFDDYMRKYPFKLDDKFDKLKEELMKNRTKKM